MGAAIRLRRRCRHRWRTSASRRRITPHAKPKRSAVVLVVFLVLLVVVLVVVVIVLVVVLVVVIVVVIVFVTREG